MIFLEKPDEAMKGHLLSDFDFYVMSSTVIIKPVTKTVYCLETSTSRAILKSFRFQVCSYKETL